MHVFLGIFAYLNYQVPREQSFVVDTLLNGLGRLEYRGYDSAGTHTACMAWHKPPSLAHLPPRVSRWSCTIPEGLAFDADNSHRQLCILKRTGRVNVLRDAAVSAFPVWTMCCCRPAH